MRVIGLDSGSTTTKGVLFEHGKLQKRNSYQHLVTPK